MKTKWSLRDYLALVTIRFQKNGVIADIKFEPDSDNGWGAAGNCWVNGYIRGMVFPITFYELITDGWVRV